jgi:hypothetical protein
MWTPSRGIRLVGVTADTTPERVKVGRAGATSVVGIVGPLLPQAHIETARIRTSDRRLMDLDSAGPLYTSLEKRLSGSDGYDRWRGRKVRWPRSRDAASLGGEHHYRPKEDIALALQRDLFEFVTVGRLENGHAHVTRLDVSHL